MAILVCENCGKLVIDRMMTRHKKNTCVYKTYHNKEFGSTKKVKKFRKRNYHLNMYTDYLLNGRPEKS